MRKWRLIFISVISLAMLALTMVCSASWFVVYRESDPTSYQTIDPTKYFTTEAVYTGEVLTPSLRSEDEGFEGGFTYVWTRGYFRIASGSFAAGTYPINGGSVHQQVAAGTHYFDIIDTYTGETIATDFAFTIKPAAVSAPSIVEDSLTQSGYFDTNKFTYKISWPEAKQSGAVVEFQVSDTVNGNYESDTLVATNQNTATAYYLKNLTTPTSYFDLWNNYDVENAAVAPTPTYTVVATCYSTGGYTKYYGTLNKALEVTAAQTNASKINLVAMQSFDADPDGDGTSSTFLSSTAAKTNHFTHAISGVKTVASNVSLIIPYKKTSSFDASEKSVEADRYGLNGTLKVPDDKVTAYAPTPTCVNVVELSGTLNNSGTINLCGVIGWDYYSSQFVGEGATTGNYAMIRMAKKAIINTAGKLDIYGYITNLGLATADTADDAVINATAGTIYMPFVIYDHYGGGMTIGDFQTGKISPLVIFDSPNIHATLKCTGGASGVKVYGYADLFTGGTEVNGVPLIGTVTIPNQHNLAEVRIFGYDANYAKGGLFNLSDGSATFRYVPTKGADFGKNADIPTLEAETEITLNGSAQSGSLELTITISVDDIPIIGTYEHTETVSMTEVMFPVSSKFTLNLEKNGTKETNYTFNTSFKLLPGSTLNVGAGVNLNVNGNLLVYEGWTADRAGTLAATRYNEYAAYVRMALFYKHKYDQNAVCNIAGTMTVNGGVGGVLTPTSGSAKLVIASNAALTVQEQEGVGAASGADMLSGGTFRQTGLEKQTARGTIANPTAVANSTFTAGKTYYATSSGNAWRERKSITIKYHVNGGDATIADRVEQLVYSDTRLTLGDAQLPSTTRIYYDFDAWYTDEACTIPARDQVLYSDTINLYAKWTPITYTFQFEYVASGFEFTDENRPKPPNALTFTVDQAEGFTLPTDPDPESELNFNAWYTNAACTSEYVLNPNAATRADRAFFADMAKDNVITVYGKWTAVTFTINFTGYDRYNQNDIPHSTITLSPSDRTIEKLPIITAAYETDPSKDKYFVGWSYDNESGNPVIIPLNSIETLMYTFLPENPETDMTFTFTALWEDKVSISYTASDTSIYTDLVKYGDAGKLWYKEGTLIDIESDLRTYNDGHYDKQWYFLSWTCNGEAMDSDVTQMTITENTVIEITWMQKAKLTVDYNYQKLTDMYGYTSEIVWVTPGLTYTTAHTVTEKDDEPGLMQYFTNWTATNCSISGKVITVNADATEASVTANWNPKYQVTFDGTESPQWCRPGSTIELPGATRTGYTFNGWFTAAEGGDKIGMNGAAYSAPGDITLYAQWTQNSYKITVSKQSNATVTVSGGIDGQGQKAHYNDTITVKVEFSYNNNSRKLVVKDANGNELLNKTDAGTYTFTMPDSNVTIEASSEDSCLVEGTLITMADGTQKPVEDLKVGDMILIFNHVTGQLEAMPLIFNTHDKAEAADYDVLHLIFSNGTEVKIVASHGFFDMTLMKYVYITYNNYEEFLGHSFYAMTANNEVEIVTLTDAFIQREHVRVFCPVTYFHMNSFANGLLNTPNIPGDITGLVNYFEYDSDLKYNEEAMAADIEKYGLYTYDDFKDYISYEAYLSSPAVYLKVAVEKGMITYEEIIDIILYLLEGSLIDSDTGQ